MKTIGKIDVFIAGGGIAGSAAAIASARMGAKTLLAERYGFLGGACTAGLVSPFMTWLTSDGKPLIKGIFQEMLEKLGSQGGLKGRAFDAAAFSFVLQEMVLDSGADILLHSWVCGASVEGGALVEANLQTKSGTVPVRAKCFIDCTGDADLAFYSGAPFQKGRESDGLAQAATVVFDLSGVDLRKTLEYVKQNPDDMRFPKLPEDADLEEALKEVVSVAGFYSLVEQARKDGAYNVPGDLVFFVSRPNEGEVVVNTTHVGGVDCADSGGLTQAEIEGRRQMMNAVSFFRKYIPGFENCRLARFPTQVGVRETRRIVGEYIFSARDIETAAKHPDAIARLAYEIDIHDPKGSGYTKQEEKQRKIAPPKGDWYEIPYRCLLPLEVENLLTAGRCVSSTHEGHSAIRIMPSCAAMGQAAGIAAALSAEQGISPRQLDVNNLLAELRRQGALV